MRPVPVGTVDFVTTTLYPFMCRAMASATWRTKVRSGEPSGFGGVPTAMKIASALSIDDFKSVVNVSLPARSFLATISSRPGS